MNSAADIYLIEPKPDDEAAVWRYRQIFIDRGDTLAGTAGLADASSFEAWLQGVKNNADEATVRSGYVPAQLYLAKRIDNDELAGMIEVRSRLNDYLLQVGGHIGYSVHPAERGKGYATEMLRLALAVYRENSMQRVLVTCDRTNVASAKVIQANGGKLENEITNEGIVKQRYWIALE